MFRRLLIFATLPVLLAVTAVPQRGAPPVRAGDIVITGGQLFDGVRDTLVPEHRHRRPAAASFSRSARTWRTAT